MNKNKNIIITSIAIVTIVMVMGILSSYAFFKRTFEDGDKQTATTAGTANLDIDFESDEYINNTSGVLIDEADYLTKADATKFTINKPSSSNISNDIYFDVLLTDIAISDNLKSSYFVWKLVKDTDTVVASGNFASIGTNTTLTLSTNNKLSSTQNYSIYIYLKNDENVNQIDLLKGTFSAKVAVEAYVGKA